MLKKIGFAVLMLCSALALVQPRTAQAAERYENRVETRFDDRGGIRYLDRAGDRRVVFEREAHCVHPAGYYDQFGCWHAYGQRW